LFHQESPIKKKEYDVIDPRMISGMLCSGSESPESEKRATVTPTTSPENPRELKNRRSFFVGFGLCAANHAIEGQEQQNGCASSGKIPKVPEAQE